MESRKKSPRVKTRKPEIISSMKIDHVNIVVKDLEKAKEFFIDLGFVLKNEGQLTGEWINKISGLKNVNAKFAALGFPDKETILELLTFSSPEIIPDEHISKPNHQGYMHFAIEVSNIEEEVNKLKEKGIHFLSDIQWYGSGKKLCYFLGPEGVLLELSEYV